MTLVEIIVTIAIMGIIASISMPNTRIREYRLQSQARILLNDIRKIKHRSMTEGGTHILYLEGDSYVVKSTTNYVKHEERVELGEDMKIVDNLERKISFNSNGCPIKAGTITIEDKVTMKFHDITIIPYTGRILLKQQE